MNRPGSPSPWQFLLHLLVLLLTTTEAFQSRVHRTTFPRHSLPYLSTKIASSYTPPEATPPPRPKSKNSLHPKIGDVVRFYDLDGGKEDGEVLVGRISFLQYSTGEWVAELTPLDSVGDGYYADPPGRRRRKTTTRKLSAVSPIAASFVRTEAAWKVPLRGASEEATSIVVRAETYDLDDYTGPVPTTVNTNVVESDGAVYQALKTSLLKYTALTGLAGAIAVELSRGIEDAVIFGAGVAASLVYLFLLTVKTDTMASPDAKLGRNVSNLRFVVPTFVLVGVALYNQSRGDANPLQGQGMFDTVTAEQFGAAILGFLTYRIPLFVTQIVGAMQQEGGDVTLPGSAGVAMQLAKGSSEETASALADIAEDLTTVLLVSGPQATGRSALVDRLVQDGDGKYVRPKRIDRFQDGSRFEQLESKNAILHTDASGRFGLSTDGILEASTSPKDSVVVVDADVELTKKLVKIGGLRLVSVWVGLGSVAEFESRLKSMIDSGEISIDEDETKESVIRARVREIVQEIEYGISSGIFEFTILNVDEQESLRELKAAAAYCFD